ncbi:4-alpha-glucanotransferase [Fuerstiella marisgermanici]|uniref:4-alpha-glucanotransferase n=1 Tax=Fuerstiella marisgermanici TaxID=1891926 RepID=A0A1P8WHQ9_9PLAN|nr:4-alpha-glucanotransferase [Fuerstiella marisgermanici]APZ93599.1 4-alpha-glucanotransferase [Fuerstiella marisgermanici]
MRFPRSSGVLLPVFSLPAEPSSSAGASDASTVIGDLGASAYRFVDFLQSAGQTIWQLLPLGPPALGDSPYSSYSAFAGNPLLISCDLLVADGLLTPQQLADAAVPQDTCKDRVHYDLARATKLPLLKLAFNTFRQQQNHARNLQYADFCERNQAWLIDFARFDAFSHDFGDPDWSKWDAELIRRTPAALADVDSKLADEIEFAKFQQFVFADQWSKLKSYAHERDVQIYGDMPIFVAYESVDVWTDQHLFMLDDAGRPTVVAGVPPDYFSATGQMWGNPLYRWDRIGDSGYEWWIRRFRQAFEFFDILRIDHFRGFESYWEIPANAENAIAGQWITGPRDAPFEAARAALGDLPIVAEDLGLITDEVHWLRDRLGFPGMRVLQFGYEDDSDPYHRPDAWPDHSVGYSGTHDNDTVMGWYAKRKQDGTDAILNRFLSGDPDSVHVELVRSVLNSAADTAILPMQDILGLGSEARINTPGEAQGNWTWRCSADALTEDLASRLRSWTEASGRRRTT